MPVLNTTSPTTIQDTQPAGVDGQQIYNTTSGQLETFANGVWGGVQTFPLLVQSAVFTLSSADIMGMFATPLLLFARPGGGQTWIIDKCIANYVAGTTPYTGGGQITLKYGNNNGSTNNFNATNAFFGTFLAIDYSVNNLALNTGPSLLSLSQPQSILSYVDVAIYITNTTAAFTAGDGTINLYLTYYALPGLV